MKTKANLARGIVALFAIALLQGPICSNACATELCPAQHRTENSCDHKEHRSHHSDHQTPPNRDCPRQLHLDTWLANAPDLAASQLHTASRFSASSTPAIAVQIPILIST